MPAQASTTACCQCASQVEASKQAEALQGAEQAVRQLGQQLQQQVAADLGRQQGEVQQLLARHSAEVARDTIKQFRADQVCVDTGVVSGSAMLGSGEA